MKPAGLVQADNAERVTFSPDYGRFVIPPPYLVTLDRSMLLLHSVYAALPSAALAILLFYAILLLHASELNPPPPQLPFVTLFL